MNNRLENYNSGTLALANEFWNFTVVFNQNPKKFYFALKILIQYESSDFPRLINLSPIIVIKLVRFFPTATKWYLPHIINHKSASIYVPIANALLNDIPHMIVGCWENVLFRTSSSSSLSATDSHMHTHISHRIARKMWHHCRCHRCHHSNDPPICTYTHMWYSTMKCGSTAVHRNGVAWRWWWG